MKIKSWTGEMVEARVAMKGTRQCFNGVWEIVDDYETGMSMMSSGLLAHDFENFTMLHCPFQVGDETEFLYTFPDNWIENGKIESQLEADRCNNSFRVRHANPNLRASPEYRE